MPKKTIVTLVLTSDRNHEDVVMTYRRKEGWVIDVNELAAVLYPRLPVLRYAATESQAPLSACSLNACVRAHSAAAHALSEHAGDARPFPRYAISSFPTAVADFSKVATTQQVVVIDLSSSSTLQAASGVSC
jgi:hypothetical protein